MALTPAARDLLLRAVGDTPAGLIAAALPGLEALWGTLTDPGRTVIIRLEARRLLLVDILRRIKSALTPEEQAALETERLTINDLIRGDELLLQRLGGLPAVQGGGAAVYTFSLDYLEPIPTDG